MLVENGEPVVLAAPSSGSRPTSADMDMSKHRRAGSATPDVTATDPLDPNVPEGALEPTPQRGDGDQDPFGNQSDDYGSHQQSTAVFEEGANPLVRHRPPPGVPPLELKKNNETGELVGGRRKNGSTGEEDPFGVLGRPPLGLEDDPDALDHLNIAEQADIAAQHRQQDSIQVVSTSPQERKLSAGPRQSGFTTEEAEAAKKDSKLFVPAVKREQYIPVRVARDKIKQVLSEMANMKVMHLAALETMEKQHSFLKAQLESSVAAYAKKLTTDYNNRVTALDNEYKRRLGNVSSAAMADLQQALNVAKKNMERVRSESDEKLRERERELEQERRMFGSKLEEEAQRSQALQEKVQELEEKLAEMKDALGRSRSEEQYAQLLDRVVELESENAALKEQVQGGGGGGGGVGGGVNRYGTPEDDDE